MKKNVMESTWEGKLQQKMNFEKFTIYYYYRRESRLERNIITIYYYKYCAHLLGKFAN